MAELNYGGIILNTIFSGLAETDAVACIGWDVNTPLPMSWCSPGDFITKATASGNDSCNWLWLYRAPWSLLSIAEQDDLTVVFERWAIEQRMVLNLRRKLGGRLIIVNVDQVSPSLICAKFGLPQPLPINDALKVSSPALARLFDQAAPYYWDLYESLEASAWLPVGEPQFRSNQMDLSETSLFSVLKTLQHGLAWPGTHAELLKFELEVAELKKTREAMLMENEQMLMHLHLVQEELEAYHQKYNAQQNKLQLTQKELEALQLASSLINEQHATTLMLSEQSKVHLDELIRLEQSQKATSKAEHQALLRENELMLTHLHQVQEELERYYLANKEVASAMVKSQQTMQRARGVVTRLISHG